MSKRTLTPTTPTRVVHYIDPAPRADLVMYSPRQIAARRREQAARYNRWVERQHAIAEHDRKVRRFLLGFGATIGLGLLAVLTAAGWLVYPEVACDLIPASLARLGKPVSFDLQV